MTDADRNRAIAELASYVTDLLTWARDEAVANQFFPQALDWREQRDECRAIAEQFSEPKGDQHDEG